MSETMKFRKAVPGDEGLILTFIRELADYEGMLDQVVADEATLHTWIFEKEKAEVLFVLEGETEVGFALFFHNFSTFLGRAGLYLEDLALFQKLAQIALERGCGRMEWWCLDWNRPSIDFYTKGMGAEPMSDWTVYRLAGETLKQAANQP